ncbi:MAG TPA: shikimate kinase [Desulfobulbus sp.]|nr:shikimate kinase [Desulfobulbus sp.]
MRPAFFNISFNIILIGMAGVGKSTVGHALARICGKKFIDTDDLITEQVGMGLQEYLDQVGIDVFQRIEEKMLLTITPQGLVVATGGSAVYSEAGMAHLQTTGPIILLEARLTTLEQRVHNRNTRGLVNPGTGGFQDLYYARRPLYHKWAGLRIPADTGSPEDIARAILDRRHDTGPASA